MPEVPSNDNNPERKKSSRFDSIEQPIHIFNEMRILNLSFADILAGEFGIEL